MTSTKLNVLAISGISLSDTSLKKLRDLFATVHYHPDGNVPRKEWKEVEVWYTRYAGFPEGVGLEDIPKTRALQLSSAGANVALQHPVFQTDEGKKQIKVCSASGIHSLSIPQYIIAQTVNLYMTLHIQLYLGRKNAKWPSREEIAGPVTGGHTLHSKSLYGKTAGLLGYGHIGREAARALKALNVKIIAANSSGEKRADEGEGSIPEACYSTNDPASFRDFLSKTDILIASLPSTPATRFLLKKKHLEALPEGAVFINVGRGDLVRSDDLVAALDAPKGLFAVALDVTDPEPLGDGHPLWTHPRAIVTPHTSGDFDGYFDAGADLLVANVEKYRKEGKFINVIDPAKGY